MHALPARIRLLRQDDPRLRNQGRTLDAFFFRRPGHVCLERLVALDKDVIDLCGQNEIMNTVTRVCHSQVAASSCDSCIIRFIIEYNHLLIFVLSQKRICRHFNTVADQ